MEADINLFIVQTDFNGHRGEKPRNRRRERNGDGRRHRRGLERERDGGGEGERVGEIDRG